jgi:hypothetical protein
METTVFYPKEQPQQSTSVAQNEEHQQDTSRLCTPDPSKSVSNKRRYRSLDSISPTPNRPKLRAIHSSDTSRFPTLERLEHTMLFSKNSKITVVPVTFVGDSANNNMTKVSQVSQKTKSSSLN